MTKIIQLLGITLNLLLYNFKIICSFEIRSRWLNLSSNWICLSTFDRLQIHCRRSTGLQGCSNLLRDVTAFLVPELKECDTFLCELDQSDLLFTELIATILKKLNSLLLVNKAAAKNALKLPLTPKFVHNSRSRRWQTINQVWNHFSTSSTSFCR